MQSDAVLHAGWFDITVSVWSSELQWQMPRPHVEQVWALRVYGDGEMLWAGWNRVGVSGVNKAGEDISAIMSAVVSSKEKKSFSKKLFRRSSVRSVGSFMNRVLRTLSTLSHFGTDEQAVEDEKDDATSLQTTTGGSLPSDDSDCGGFPFGDKVPGVAGLKNHGNTCFMNAILQCLSNTELFAEYLALEQFRIGDTAGTNDKAKSSGAPVQKKAGQQPQEAGEVTEQLSGLVRALWTFEYTPQHSRDFKVRGASKLKTAFKSSFEYI